MDVNATYRPLADAEGSIEPASGNEPFDRFDTRSVCPGGAGRGAAGGGCGSGRGPVTRLAGDAGPVDAPADPATRSQTKSPPRIRRRTRPYGVLTYPEYRTAGSQAWPAISQTMDAFRVSVGPMTIGVTKWRS